MKFLLFIFPLLGVFSAEEMGSEVIHSQVANSGFSHFAIAAGMAIGLSVLGGTLGQGFAAAAALGGISRNPSASGKIFVPMILCMALIESLVLFGLLVSFTLIGKI